MPRGRAGGRLGGGHRAGHGFGAHHRAGHGFGGHGIGGHGIGRSHFHNHHFHHHGNHLFNSRPRRHLGLGHGGPRNFAIHMGTNQNGVSTVTVTGDRATGVNGSRPRPPNSVIIVIIVLIVLGLVCSPAGAILGTIGAWVNSVRGIVGIALLVFGVICWGLLILSLLCLSLRHPNPATPVEQDIQEGNRTDVPHPNIAEPTTTAQGGVTNPPQGEETTSFVIQTPGGIGMRQQTYTFNFTGTAQPLQQLIQNLYTGTPNPPTASSETLPYPPPQSNPTTADLTPYPGATAPPLDYPVAYPPVQAEGKVDVVKPALENLDDVPPPPSYNDAVTGFNKRNDDDGKT